MTPRRARILIAGLVVGHGSLWAGNYARRSVLRIDQ